MPNTPMSRSRCDESPGLPESNAGARIECRSCDLFVQWLAELPGSLAITTYQAGKLALLGTRQAQPSLLMRQFTKPMGLAVGSRKPHIPGKLALVTKTEITFLSNSPLLAPGLLPGQPNRYDALYLPRATYHTGDLNVHDAAFGDDGLWFVNTRFSCLSTLSHEVSFVPRWHPPFISELAPEDRCHLNGLAMVEGKPRYVTALGETNTCDGWRQNKANGGVLLDVETGVVLLRGLSMPHSPRWHRGKLWLLNSGAGELLCYDPAQNKAQVVCTLPAYLRGLALIGQYAVIGLCQIREKHYFGDLPVQKRHRQLMCGLAVVDLSIGKPLGTFEFTGGCTEIYDVQFLAGARNVNVLNLTDDTVRQAFPAPDFSYWLRPQKTILDLSR